MALVHEVNSRGAADVLIHEVNSRGTADLLVCKQIHEGLHTTMMVCGAKLSHVDLQRH